MQSFPDVLSPVSGKMMFEVDENRSLRLRDPLTRNEAIRALVRMADYCRVELDPEWADYVSIAEAGTYDNAKDGDALPETEQEWAVIRAYWEMLAKRYAGIPSKYLTFDLCNEITPRDTGLDAWVTGIASVRDAIWNVDPDRVLLYSFADSPKEKKVDAMAALGIAIGCHCYKPYLITAADWEYTETNPYADVVWPQPVFPMGQICGGQAPLTITGAISGCKLSFHIWTSSNKASAEISADGKQLETIRMDGGVLGDDGEYYYGDTLYSVDIPEGTKKIELWVRNGGARFDTFIIEGNGQKVTMAPSDTCDYLDQSDPLPLVVNSDGTYTNSENKVYDVDRIYEESVMPYQAIAKKYGVGFMINEFGCYGTSVYWDINTIAAYHETVLEMLEKYDLGWCYCEIFGDFPKHFIVLYGNKSQWTGATVEEITCDFGDHTQTIKVCKELLDGFRKYTLKSK